MSVKLVKLGKFLNENLAVRHMVSDAFMECINDGAVDMERIADKLFEISQRMDSSYHFTREEILILLQPNTSKKESIIEPHIPIPTDKQNSYGRCRRTRLYNSGAFVADQMIYKYNASTKKSELIYDSSNICVNQYDDFDLNNCGDISYGDFFYVRAYVYAKTGSDPTSDWFIYDNGADKIVCHEVGGTTCNTSFSYLGIY